MIDLPLIEAAGWPTLLRQLGRWRDALALALALPAVSARGVYLEAVEVGTSATQINHKLPSAPRGWLLLRVQGTAAASVVETASDARTLTLVASAAVTVDLWVWP